MEVDTAEAAEGRLEARSRERRRRAERRARRERLALWLGSPLLLPAAGAAVAIAILERSGGDLAGWSTPAVWAAVLAVFGLPAAISLWLARRRSWPERLGWAAITMLLQIALVVWVGLLVLSAGPE